MENPWNSLPIFIRGRRQKLTQKKTEIEQPEIEQMFEVSSHLIYKYIIVFLFC